MGQTPVRGSQQLRHNVTELQRSRKQLLLPRFLSQSMIGLRMGVCESTTRPSSFSGSRETQEEDMKEKAFSICREFLSGSWKKINSHDMVFKSISGGTSNILYYCSLPSTHTPLNGEPNQVLLRMYGQLHSEPPQRSKDGSGGSHEAAVATVTDSVIFMMLSERNLGPKLYGIFPGGRLEEYIPARAMMCQELRDPNLSAIIARKTANVHCLDVPINKEPTWLFATMHSWLAAFRDKSPVEGNPISSHLLAFDFHTEINWLRTFLKKIESPVCFCHNDLQEGNILLPDFGPKKKGSQQAYSDDSVVLIDFEYCSYNYRASDIANHFCEWVYDYSNPDYPHFSFKTTLFPSEFQRRFFIREYLTQLKKQRRDVSSVTEDEVDRILYEADNFVLASHLLWTLWGIQNAYHSAITFGYWEYAKTRLDHYLTHKKRLLDSKQ